MGKKFLRLLALLIAMIVAVNPAFATQYECEAKDAVVWEKDSLNKTIPDPKTVVRFNDKTSVFWIGERPSGIKLQIIQEAGLGFDRDLVAVLPHKEGTTPINIILRIKGGKYFLLLDDSGATSGQCHT